MCKQHALRIAWTIARSIAFLDFWVLRWKFTYDWKCVNTTYRVPLFCPLPASRKGLRLTLRSALFGEGGRDWRPCIWTLYAVSTYQYLESCFIHFIICHFKHFVFEHFIIEWEWVSTFYHRLNRNSLPKRHYTDSKRFVEYAELSILNSPLLRCYTNSDRLKIDLLLRPPCKST